VFFKPIRGVFSEAGGGLAQVFAGMVKVH
jgi:hypothetical protein